MDTLRGITAALLIIGGINWGLIGLFQYNLVAAIFGSDAAGISRIIYSLVGFSALYQIFTYPWGRRTLVTEQRDQLRRVG